MIRNALTALCICWSCGTAAAYVCCRSAARACGATAIKVVALAVVVVLVPATMVCCKCGRALWVPSLGLARRQFG